MIISNSAKKIKKKWKIVVLIYKGKIVYYMIKARKKTSVAARISEIVERRKEHDNDPHPARRGRFGAAGLPLWTDRRAPAADA
jgi:hypothetical protein